MATKVIKYKGEDKLEKGIEKMTRDGWELLHQEQVHEKKKIGCGGCSGCSWLLFGSWLTLFDKNEYLVTFKKD
jgi:hypothetical protein